MKTIPGVVGDYLQDWAPKGDLLGYWLDKEGMYNVLVLYMRDGAYRFSLGVFPKAVGHWGHQLTGGECGLQEMKQHLDFGNWDSDKVMKERLTILVDRIEKGLGFEDIIATCQEIYDPLGRFKPRKSPEPLRGPRLSSEGDYRRVLGLVESLSDRDSETARRSAQKLGEMGITEDYGPLFARDGLWRYRKRTRPISEPQTGERGVPPSGHRGYPTSHACLERRNTGHSKPRPWKTTPGAGKA